jgi:hypothetical protein
MPEGQGGERERSDIERRGIPRHPPRLEPELFWFSVSVFSFVVRQRMSLRANHYHHDSIRVRLPIKNEIKSHLDLRLCEKFDWIKIDWFVVDALLFFSALDGENICHRRASWLIGECKID